MFISNIATNLYNQSSISHYVPTTSLFVSIGEFIHTMNVTILTNVSSAEHASRNVCDNRNVRGVLARELTRAPREIT